MATRFPEDATSTDKLWEFLLRARSAAAPFPSERLNADAFFHPDPEHGGTFAVEGGHFLAEDPAAFDAAFFNVIKTELLTLDPQQRLVMESVYHALENAGIPMQTTVGSRTSVFASGFNHDHLALLNSDPESTIKYKPTSVTNSIISNRVSWFFDFKSSSMTIDTACSSSMVALHLAAQSLHAHESEMAVVSGVNIVEFPIDIVGMSHHGFLGANGRCFSFDHRANGYARGEGVGSLIIKPLSSAIRDGDTIRAVLRGTGVNQDGRTPGISLPSATAQEKLIQEIYKNAGLNPADTHFVEAHGTGTAAGDPIEAGAIASAFKSRRKGFPLHIGAIKSGVGHLEGGAGIAGIIKSVLILENGIIPPNANFEKVNPKIPTKKWNITFPVENVPWPIEGPRRISVNSFGVGGTNGHCILDDAYHYLKDNNISAIHNTRPTIPSQDEISQLIRSLRDDHGDGVVNGVATGNGNINGHVNGANGTNGIHKEEVPTVFPLTAFDDEGIKRNADALTQYLSDKPFSINHGKSDLLADLSFTLSEKRSKFPWKSFVLASSKEELKDNLFKEKYSKPVRARNAPMVGFVFTGQGAQHWKMGRELFVYPVFGASVEMASEYMKSLGSEWTLTDELFKDKDLSLVNESYLSHPSCSAIQIALVDLLASWNVYPERVVGHSSGEIPAAYAAGRLTREGAWKAAYFRGYVSAKQLAAKGAMLAVGLSETQLTPYLERVHSDKKGELIIACYNSPKNNTVSGDETMVNSLKGLLDADRVFARKLNVKNAYHSAHMKEVSSDYHQLMGDLSAGTPFQAPHKALMFSTVTGLEVQVDHLEAQYWVENMVSPVRFTDGLSAMCYKKNTTGQGHLRMNTTAESIFADHLLEIGPHAALQSAIKEVIAAKGNQSPINYLPVLNRSESSPEVLLNTVGTLYAKGGSVKVTAVNTAADSERTKPHLLIDLPPYRFNHSSTTMYESRLSKNYRFRKHPRHDLFGAPVPDWNEEIPRWRHFLRLQENPWLKDHLVTNNYVFPGVGYIVMAIEATHQQADPSSTVIGFRLKNIALKRALIIPDIKEGIETCVSLTRMDESSLWSSSIWKRFQVTSYNPIGDDWVEHCTGYIAIDYKTTSGPVDAGREEEEEKKAWAETLKSVVGLCQQPVDFEKSYENLQTAGLSFGPLFRNLKNVHVNGKNLGSVMGTVTVPDIPSSMPKSYVHPHLIHPATMDSMLHLFLAAVLDFTGKPTLEKAAVPTFIREVWLSADLSSAPGHAYTGYGKAGLIAYDKYECDVKIWDQETQDPRISIKGIRVTPLESGNSDSSQVRKLCHNLEWKPALQLLDPETACGLSNISPPDIEKDNYWVQRYQLATMLLVTDALAVLEGFNPSTLNGHLKQYWDWMNFRATELKENKISQLLLSEFDAFPQTSEAKDALYREVEDHSADGALAIRMGRNIVSVLREESDPLHLMFGQDDLMDRVYDEVVHLGDLPIHLKSYLTALGDNRTDLSVLEVGAGTGSSTAAILDVLSPDIQAMKEVEKASRISSYSFTDISAGFFEKAKERFKHWNNIMQFRTLNAEKDPLSQGFEAGTYDLVVAGNVIHATADVRKTLKNLRMLLKPGGKILMHEGNRQDLIWSQIAFGQLPGWWLGVEPIRKWCPFLTPAQWDVVFKDSGFSGVDIEFPSSQNPDNSSQSILVGTAIRADSDKDLIDHIILLDHETRHEITAGLEQSLLSLHHVTKVTIISPNDLPDIDLTSAICISLLEVQNPFLEGISECGYLGIRKLVATGGGLLWVTGNPLVKPEFDMILGLLRTVRWERDLEAANLASVSIIEDEVSPTILLNNLMKIFKNQFIDLFPSEFNSEFQLKNGRIYTSRLVDSDSGNDFLKNKFAKANPQMITFGDSGRPIKLSTSSPGLLNKLEWVTDTIYDEPLGETQVEIDIKAVGLNFRDLMIAMGEHMAYSLGNEAGGIVTRVGSAVDRVKPGDRVVYLCGLESTGCFHTFGRVDQNVVCKIPDNLSYEIAAGLPCVYATVIYGLNDAARLLKDETILIHAAAGGVGQAAIHYSKMVGAEIYATVSTPEKRDLLVAEYGIQEDHIFSSRDLTFVKGIMRCTKGKGVDVVLNSLSGEALRASWDCLAPFGRFIEIGKKDAQAYGKVELTPFLRNVTMASVELPTMMRHRPSLIARLTEDTIRLWSEGKVKEAKPTTIMNYSQVEEGLRLLQSGKGMGKMIFVPGEEDLISVVPESSSPYQFKENASYVLAGGTGGLGRSIASWMVSRGVKHLIFLARSRPSAAVQDFIKDLEEKGCNVKISLCDVSDKDRLNAVVDECRTYMPPIKGVIQGAMVLKDGMFENMPYEDWNVAIKPKVRGSWNLHEALPRDMDFFVMLSSATGILGNRSQANYAAGNTYQDALSRYRASLGLPSASVDLGSVLSVGFVAENKDYARHTTAVLEVLREDEIHTILEYLIDPIHKSKATTQLIAGLTTGTMYHERGVPSPSYLNFPMFTHLRKTKVSSAQNSEENPTYLVQSLLIAATTLEEAVNVVSNGIRNKLASLLAIPVGNIDPSKSISSNGVDSLVAMEFRTWLVKDLCADIPLLEITGTASITTISHKIASVSKLAQFSITPPKGSLIVNAR
ncbi:iterative type I polyketide synthase [Talaromyces proteolyticus]|uniref:Iterative type I polyketide synthase n=1 Tax=Talaromyces proteolyticus TaxID=1131652 RepID=A0AAD4KXH3_9EURO|nr:iterative type I polyketide synthase [Talaromyces proteolyticus]KAH8703346.1 iterative type I polyketide synthase [Talaromyces proteolyticus]